MIKPFTRQNLELKARYHWEPETVRPILRSLNAREMWTKRQTDTYFSVPHGKLKLREVPDEPGELIAYARSNRPEAKISDFTIFTTEQPEELKKVLAATVGVQTVVEKTRTLYLWKNVRLHFDRVRDLGSFIEFEAMLSTECSEQLARQRLDYLVDLFEIAKEDLISVGYYELIRQGKF